MSEPYQYRMPEDVIPEFKAIRQAVIDLHVTWTVYSCLTKPENISIMREITPDVFAVILVALRNEITMALGRLLDPPETTVKKEKLPNLSVARLLDTVSSNCPSDVFSGFEKGLEESKRHCAGILIWRNKHTGHADWKTALDPTNNPLPIIDPKEIATGLEIVGNLLNDIDIHFNDRATPFAHPTMRGTPDDLMMLLRTAWDAQDRALKDKLGLHV